MEGKGSSRRAVLRAGMAGVTNRFDGRLAERATFSWTAKGGSRVTLGVWSKKRTLQPGERLRISSDYSAR